jgi:hypothetical protein
VVIGKSVLVGMIVGRSLAKVGTKVGTVVGSEVRVGRIVETTSLMSLERLEIIVSGTAVVTAVVVATDSVLDGVAVGTVTGSADVGETLATVELGSTADTVVGVTSGAVPVPVPVIPEKILDKNGTSVVGVDVGATTAVPDDPLKVTPSEAESVDEVGSTVSEEEDDKIPPGPNVIPPVEDSVFGVEDSDVEGLGDNVGRTTKGGSVPVDAKVSDPSFVSDDEVPSV